MIRSASVTDAKAIAEIHVSAWRAAYRGQVPDTILDALDLNQRAGFWRDVLSSQHGVLVAVAEMNILGFCAIVPSRDDDAAPREVAEIAALYVDARHWRRGVGRRLCSRAFEAAATAGFSVMTLWVLASNTDAIAFYEANGFILDGATKSEPASSDFTFEELRMRRCLLLAAEQHDRPDPE